MRIVEMPDSFDMLLDTLCNTLGGLIFISLLVSVLASSLDIPAQADNVQKQHEKNRNEVIELETQLVELTGKKESLTAMLQSMPDPADTVASGGEYTRKLALELNGIMQNLLILKKKLKDIEHKAERFSSGAPTNVNRIRNEINALEKDKSVLENKIAAKTQIEERKIRLAKLRISQKASCHNIIKNAKIYPVDQVGTDTFNDNDLILERKGNSLLLTPMAEKGIPILRDGKISPEIIAYVEKFEKNLYTLNFWTCADSYRELIILRDFVVSKGYQYNWKPLKNKSGTLEILPGEGGSFAQ